MIWRAAIIVGVLAVAVAVVGALTMTAVVLNELCGDGSLL